MTVQDKVSARQFAALIFAGLFAPVTRVLPRTVVRIAGASGWVAPLVAFLPLVALILFVRHMMRQTQEGEGLAELILRLLGRPVGRVVCVLYGLWILFYCGFVLRSGGERLLSTIYTTGSLPFFLALLLLVATVPVLGKVRYAVRCAEIFFLILLLTLAQIFGFAMPGIHVDYLLPVDVLAWREIGLAALPVVNVVSTFVYACFLGGYVRRPAPGMKSTLRWLLLLLVAMTLLIVTTVGMLGPGMTRDAQFPFFMMTRNISVFQIIERVEALVTIVWVATDFIFVSMLLMAATEICRVVFGGRREHYAIPGAAVVYAVSLLVAPNAFRFFGVAEDCIPLANALFVFAGLPLIWLLRKKGTKKVKKGVDKGGGGVL